MRTKYLFLICLFFTFAVLLPSVPAQDYTQWSLPEGATVRIGKGTITSNIAYSPDGSRLAVGSSIGIWIYDAHTGKELDLIVGHTGVDSIAYSPDGKTLAAASRNEVRLWDAKTGKHKTTLKGHTDSWFSSVAYSSDGKTVATASRDYTVCLWDANTGKSKTTLIERKDNFYSATFVTYSPDGKIIAIAGESDVHLWDTVTGRHKTTLKGHADSINSLAFSPDGTTLATTSRNEIGRLWDTNTGKNKKILEKLSGERFSVVYSPDGRTLATAIGTYVGLWDVDTGTHKKTLKGHLPDGWGYVYSIAYSPDGKTIATANEGEVRLWDADTGKNTVTLGHDLIGVATYSPDGKIIATARYSHDHGVVSLWDAVTGAHKKDYSGPRGYIDKSIPSVADGFFGQTFYSPPLGSIESLTYSPDGKTIATLIGTPTGNQVHVWDANTGKQHEITLKGDTRWISSVAYSPDGKIIAIAGRHEVGLWDLGARVYKNTLKLPRNSNRPIAYSPDGTTLASGEGDEVYLWDTNTGKHKNTLKEHAERWRDPWLSIVFVAYSPDEKTIITASSDGRVIENGEVRLWDADTGKHISTFTDYISLVYSPDRKTVATTSTPFGEVHLWDARMKKHITVPGSPSVYSPDSKTLVTHYGGTILLLDTRILASQLSQQPPTSISDEQSLFDDLLDEIPQQPSMPIREVATPQTPQQIAKSALASTVLIVMEDANGQLLSTGSGFFVERGIIATNLHVVEGVFKGYVKQVGVNKTYRIERIVAMDTRQDLALVKVSDVSAPILPLGRSDKVQVGESVYVAGNPIGFLEGTFSNGIISGVREFRVGSERIQITAPISEGSSGGPVLNGKGEVIGVAVSTITVGQNLNFAIPSNYLSELLSKVGGRK